MGMIRRILNIGVGLAAGALAYKLLGDYNKNQMVEAEFTVMDPPETHGQEQAGPAAGKTVPLGGETPLQRDENGHVDPATIADPNDFQDWDDMGCRG
ncbi:MAG: hypothetical protein MSB08_08470 [Subdoligranulum sp.]|nr:hypothetical protein [Subdoligranulum sp.]